MSTKITLAVLALFLGAAVYAGGEEAVYLQKLNKELPHKFKELKTGVTLEVVREQKVVKIYMLIDDIEQYDEILVERSDEQQQNFSQCKEIKIEKGKYKNNYVELTDNYPLSSRMNNAYRVKTITSEGIMRMYPPVPVTSEADAKVQNK